MPSETSAAERLTMFLDDIKTVTTELAECQKVIAADRAFKRNFPVSISIMVQVIEVRLSGKRVCAGQYEYATFGFDTYEAAAEWLPMYKVPYLERRATTTPGGYENELMYTDGLDDALFSQNNTRCVLDAVTLNLPTLGVSYPLHNK